MGGGVSTGMLRRLFACAHGGRLNSLQEKGRRQAGGRRPEGGGVLRRGGKARAMAGRPAAHLKRQLLALRPGTKLAILTQLLVPSLAAMRSRTSSSCVCIDVCVGKGVQGGNGWRGGEQGTEGVARGSACRRGRGPSPQLNFTKDARPGGNSARRQQCARARALRGAALSPSPVVILAQCPIVAAAFSPRSSKPRGGRPPWLAALVAAIDSLQRGSCCSSRALLLCELGKDGTSGVTCTHRSCYRILNSQAIK